MRRKKTAVDNMTTAQRAELKAALRSIKTGEYKGTAVKVELEAQLNRPDGDYDDEFCHRCDGDGYVFCESCDNGFINCPADCDEGRIYDNSSRGRACPEDCDRGSVLCPDCEGEDRVNCSDCDGEGQVPRDESNPNWTESFCGEWLRNNVPKTAKDATRSWGT